MNPDQTSPILVTGITGYIGSHIVKNLLEKGYKVRGTVRSIENKEKYEFLYNFTDKRENLEIVEADLLNARSWDQAAQGCRYVIHSACPNPVNEPRNPDEVIRPAKEGTLNVLNAAVREGVKKSVITSSMMTMWLGNRDKVVSEDDWLNETELDVGSRAKILTERAVWDFWSKNKDKMEIAVINPGCVVGPILTNYKGSSVQTFLKLIMGKMPAVPNISMAAVDVRDVAEAHVQALFAKNNNGKRYLIAGRTLWLDKIASLLKGEFGPHGYSVVDRGLPSSYMKYALWFDSGVKKIMPFLDTDIKFNNMRSINELGMVYRNPERSIVEMCYSMIDHKVIPNKIKSYEGVKNLLSMDQSL